MKNFTQKFIGLLALVFTMIFTVNSQSTISLPTPTYQYAPIEDEWGLCVDVNGNVNGNVYVRITDENGNRLNENSWNGASLEHSLESGFPNESMSSFTISPGSYNYYVEAGGMGECFELSPLWSIVVNGNTIVSGEGVFGLTGSFIVEEP